MIGNSSKFPWGAWALSVNVKIRIASPMKAKMAEMRSGRFIVWVLLSAKGPCLPLRGGGMARARYYRVESIVDRFLGRDKYKPRRIRDTIHLADCVHEAHRARVFPNREDWSTAVYHSSLAHYLRL
jgi:hypothetical protein